MIEDKKERHRKMSKARRKVHITAGIFINKNDCSKTNTKCIFTKVAGMEVTEGKRTKLRSTPTRASDSNGKLSFPFPTGNSELL